MDGRNHFGVEWNLFPSLIDVPAFLAAVDRLAIKAVIPTLIRQITMDNLDLIIYADRSDKAELSSLA